MGSALRGHAAIITGASRGIGQAMAVRFSAEGAKVVVTGRPEGTRNKQLSGTLQETLDKIKAVGGTAIPAYVDFEDLDFDKGKVVKQAEAAFGMPVDILVHDAAAPREFGDQGVVPFAETTKDWFFRTVSVNVWGGWDFATKVIPGMRKKGAGWICFISSGQASPRPKPSPGMSFNQQQGGACIYGGTKAFLDRICTGAALELYADNIAVNALGPSGAIATPLSTSIISSIRQSGGSEPLETFAEAAVALCSGDPKTLTSRIAYSRTLLHELKRPVYTLDGKTLFPGWQPQTADASTLPKGYLAGH